MFACFCLCETCTELHLSQTAQKQKVTKIKVPQTSHASPVVSLSRYDYIDHIKVRTSVCENAALDAETWCFLLRCGKTWIVMSPPTRQPHLVPPCLLTVECGGVDEGTAGRKIERDVQRKGQRGRQNLLNGSCFFFPGFSWTDTSRDEVGGRHTYREVRNKETGTGTKATAFHLRQNVLGSLLA